MNNDTATIFEQPQVDLRSFEKYRIFFSDSLIEPEQIDMRLEGLAIQQLDQLLNMMQMFGIQIDSDKPVVIGSQFVKRWSLFVAGHIYHQLIHRQAFDFSWSNITVLLTGSKFYFVHNDQTSVQLNTVAEQSKMLNKFLMQSIDPLFKMISKQMGTDYNTLWSHVAYSLQRYEKEWEDELGSAETLAEVLALGYEVQPKLQATFRKVPVVGVADVIRIRERCCFSFTLPGEDRYCYTCPNITDEHRMEKYYKKKGIKFDEINNADYN